MFQSTKCTILDEKAQPRKECTSKLSPSPPHLCQHYYLIYPGTVRNVEESSYLTLFPLVDVTEHLVISQASQSNVGISANRQFTCKWLQLL